MGLTLRDAYRTTVACTTPGENRILTSAPNRSNRMLSGCLPWVLGSEALSLPRLGCLNLHTSLLPAYRGPAPIFWQFRAGETQTGVTLHEMAAKLDAGAIVGQQALPIEVGVTAPELNRALGEIGVSLVVSYLANAGAVTAQTQNEDASTYFSWPQAGDFDISTERSVQRG